MITDAALIAALENATDVLPEDIVLLPARFTLVMNEDQDPADIAREISRVLSPLKASVRPLSDQDLSILLAEIPGRIFRMDDGAAFEAGYLFSERFQLEAAEPDVQTNIFPVASPPPPEDQRREGLELPQPWCWAPWQPDLSDRPRWALEIMRVPEAWAFSLEQGRSGYGAGVIVAQPDTGIAPHVQVQDILRVAGYDFINGNTDPTDPLNYPGNPGHGTATASVVAAPQSPRMSGCAPKALHMALRAIESVARLSQVSIAQSIDFAVANGAHVITMSLGGIPSIALHRALRRAVAADVIIMAAAGNCVGHVVWPARYDDCIAVAGTNFRDAPWRGSSQGLSVDISAPAENVYRARVAKEQLPGEEVGQGQGTSFAVALTAGVAALWLAHHGRDRLIMEARARGESLQGMFRRLIRITARTPATWPRFVLGAGIVVALALLKADLDLGLEREMGAEAPRSEDEAAALSVESLVVEVLRDSAPNLDWHAYGPEIGLALLRRPIDAQSAAALAGGMETAVDWPRPVSERLATYVRHAGLRAALGLDMAER